MHGGAGDIPDSRDDGKLIGCKLAVRRGYAKLQATGSVLDAVEEAVRSMELDEYFNAGAPISSGSIEIPISSNQFLGYGSVLTIPLNQFLGYGSVLNLDGNVEMEASIMEGKTLKAGCCTLVEDIYHPISLARVVMDKTIHRFLGGKGVMKLAREQNMEILSPPGQLVTEYAKEALEEFKKHLEEGRDGTNALTEIGRRNEGGVGTVGAIAIDSQGNVAAATSTGGITGKLPGRIGDTPILGAGNYADNVRILCFSKSYPLPLTATYLPLPVERRCVSDWLRRSNHAIQCGPAYSPADWIAQRGRPNGNPARIRWNDASPDIHSGRRNDRHIRQHGHLLELRENGMGVPKGR